MLFSWNWLQWTSGRFCRGDDEEMNVNGSNLQQSLQVKALQTLQVLSGFSRSTCLMLKRRRKNRGKRTRRLKASARVVCVCGKSQIKE